jgi:hypothetical protein
VAELKKSRTLWIVTTALLALVAAVIALVNAPPLTDCISEAPASSNKHWIRAIQTVAEPWRGPHYVYGIFSVPVQYGRDRLYTAKLILQGFTEEFPETSPEAGRIYGSQVEPGHYIMRINLPTRLALWFFLTGRFGDLKTPCHWWLVITDRMG